MRLPLFLSRATLAAALLSGLAACAQLERLQDEVFTAALEGAQEVPPVATAGRGQAELRYNSKTQMLHWNVDHAALSGPLTGGHIHGPAGPGQNAGVVIPFSGNLNAPPIRGQLRITPEQFNQLDSGQWYVNLHTARHPQGEVRGQLRPSR
jgi:hypothetical protein